jgi:hypothetical protein
MIVPLLTNCPAQAKGKEDGQQLGGRHYHHHPNDHVQILCDQVGELAVAASEEI